MTYFQLRQTLYVRQVRYYLASLKQQSLAIVAFMPLAWPALIFAIVLIIAQLADTNSTSRDYLGALWLYLLFTYSLVHMQRYAINGGPCQSYLASLAASYRQQAKSELILLLYAANILLVGPLIMLAMILHNGAGRLFVVPLSTSVHQLYPIVAAIMLTSYYALRAVRLPSLPIISLLLFPLLAWSLAPLLDKSLWLLMWMAVIALEQRYLSSISLPHITLSHLLRLLLVANLRQPRNDLLRLIGLVLLVLFNWRLFNGAAPQAQPYLHSISCLLLAMLMASSLFDSLRLCRHYRYFLLNNGCSDRFCLLNSWAYVVIKSLLIWLLVNLTGLFSLADSGHWLLYLLCAMSGIVLLASRFFLLPLAGWIVLTWLT